MSSFCEVRLHNRQRQMKKYRSKLQHSSIKRIDTKLIDNDSMINTFRRFQHRMGYDYDCEDSKTLKWMKQDFQTKLVKYLGSKTYAPKKSRIEKIRAKQELNFTPTLNPLVRIFSKINAKAQKCMKWDALRALKE